MISSDRGRSWHFFSPNEGAVCFESSWPSSQARYHPYLATNRQKRAVYRTSNSKTVGWTGESERVACPLQLTHGIFTSSVHLQSALTKGATPFRLTTLPTSRAS